ncbi:uncharacterized protein N7525_006192 [Penicillium rubens]|uniref:uncharacterized protein n=1 Tax=Penicillium rubens TaxID=1108849 RepID=UPI002A5989F8|nr:uncharacterized protein N7525_006192 [Penicillium rubens]KAJ5827939.1 hypothetical protein N7525_006192 [Penicillium rubens]KAJ5849065.1 hypothetical protein N7534_007754 [Penicillium rubens]
MLLRWLVIALAQGVWANHEDERCVTAVCSAYNYISFVGLPTKGKDVWESQCRNPLKVASIYAASEIYCNEQERGIGLTQLADQCQEFGNLELLPREAVAENLTEDAIKNMRTVDYQELSRGEPADTPVLLSASYFGLMFNTIETWEFETWSHHAFGYIGYAYWGGVLSLGMAYRLCDWLFHRRQRCAERALESNVYPLIKLLKNTPLVGTGLHWIQTHLMIPSPLATTHGRHLLGFTFSTRVEALIVVGFWTISIVLSVVGYRTFPGNIYYPDVPSQILRYSADRTGIMSFANLPLLWLFGGRNNIFLWATGWSFASFNIFHRHVARVATVQAVVHSILYVVMFIQTGKAWRGLSKTYVLWGILGTFVMVLLLITSLDRIRIATYEVFLIAHIVLSILTLVGCFYHTVIFEGNEYWKYLWPTLALWVIDRFLRLVRLCYCNIHVNFSSRRLVKLSVSRMVYDETADVVRLEVTPGTPSLQPSPGQYYFLYQPFRVTGWESHPFTIGAWSYEIGDQTSLVPTSDGRTKSLDVSHVPLLTGVVSDRDYQCNSENGSSDQDKPLKLKLTFWVRPYDGWTKQLRRQCLSSPDKTSETTILLEGPYGETFPLWRYESVLIIVGGTGIASAVPYIQDHLRRSVEDWDASLENEKTRVRDMELVWTTKQAAFIQDVARRELKHALKREDFSASFYATRDSTTYSEDPTDLGFETQSGRPDLQSLIMSRACDACSAGTSLAILVCGPPRMADEARAATHLAMRQGHRFIEFVEESFTW